MSEGDDVREEAEAEAAPLSNVSRLRSHLHTDGLAIRLLDAWASADPTAAQAVLLKAVDDHFNIKKDDDGVTAPKD